MKTLGDVFREADPLGYEPRRSDMERQLSRRRVLDRPPATGVEAIPRRRFARTMAAVTLGAVGAAVAYRTWIAVDVVAAVRFEVHLAEDTPAAGLREIPVSGGARRIYLHEDAILTNSDIAHAELIAGGTATTFGVALTFNDAGASRITIATGGHVGRPLAILIDGEVVMAPVLRSPITTSAVISGDFTRAEAERIVAGIVGR
jgi:preprotein translocase subunit SecD